MRADAIDRRNKIVEAAREVFASSGEEVALETIAATAGVGIATLYRNFASREELANEVVRSILIDIKRVARETTMTLETSLDAWRIFVESLVSLNTGALSAALARYETDELPVELRALQEEVLLSVEDLLSRAVAAGIVRPGISALELILLMGMISPPKSQAVRTRVPDFMATATGIVVAGMSPRK